MPNDGRFSYLTIIRHSHGGGLSAGYTDHHFVLETVGHLAGRWLVGGGP